MFGISPLGWLHTVGSLPAIPLALFMLARHGRITPRSKAGLAYFVFMLIGAVTVFLVAKQPVSYAIGFGTLVFLLTGYGVSRVAFMGRARAYLETICLSVTVFLLFVPSVSETLRRVPDGHPIVSDPKSPLLLGAMAVLFIFLIVGLLAQLLLLYRKNRQGALLHPGR